MRELHQARVAKYSYMHLEVHTYFDTAILNFLIYCHQKEFLQPHSNSVFGISCLDHSPIFISVSESAVFSV